MAAPMHLPLQLHTPAQAAAWLREQARGTLTVDSRRVAAGDGFVAWPGAATDGRRFVPAALAAGANACLVEAQGVHDFAFADARIASYAGLKAATGPIAAAYFEQPSQQLDVLAVTGTNGKTSTAWWLAQALTVLHITLQNSEHATHGPCAQVGTLGIGVPPNVRSTGLTTPDPVRLQQAFRQMVQEGTKACAIEASSIGLAEQRLDGTRIRVAILTNFTQDHLDYHGSMQTYWQAKAALFDWPGLQAAVLNVDDAHGAQLAQQLCQRSAELAKAPAQSPMLDVWTVSCTGPARLQALAITHTAQGLQFDVVEGGVRQRLNTSMVGLYNVSNLLGVLAAMRALGVPLAAAVQACHQISAVPGRMECISEPGQPMLVVDYAHTPDALDKAIAALRPIAQARGGKLWCMVGCAGDRDAGKRPLMAAIAEQHADRVVLTSDNPRSEDPLHILQQMQQGTRAPAALCLEPDRALAIAHCVQSAAAQDVVLLAGKGHEDYQEVQGVRRPFSDPAHARAALTQRMQAMQNANSHCAQASALGARA